MTTQTIPSDQWIHFMDDFSHDYLDHLVTIEVLAGESGPQLVANNLPLQGISFDTKGSRPSTLEISAGDESGHHVSHVIEMPLHIRQLNMGDNGIELAVEPARGSITLIHVARTNKVKPLK
jgi:hypothetical protein